MTVTVLLINVTQFNPRNKHRVPPKLSLSHSHHTVTASAGHVNDDVSITGFVPPPPVIFSLSLQPLSGRKRQSISLKKCQGRAFHQF